MSLLLVFLAIALALVAVLLLVSARTLAATLKGAAPVVLIASGVGLIFLKQASVGSLFLFAGITLWRKWRPMGKMRKPNSADPQMSHVRSAALEMELDHDTGELNGIVLVGQYEGRVLSQLSRSELDALRLEVCDDGESLALLDSYFDSRFAGWREDTEADFSAGQAATSGTGPMSIEEAYEVLGLSADASAAEIRKAHRRLIKSAHPDSGGSTFLAAKVNEAKDVLLRSHS